MLQRQGNISLFKFYSKKFRCFQERASLKAAEFVHENLVMYIPGALKLYDFHVHVQSDILFFRFDVKKSVALTRVSVSQPRLRILRCVFLEHFIRLALSQRNSVILTRG